jgi:hypothetical protein
MHVLCIGWRRRIRKSFALLCSVASLKIGGKLLVLLVLVPLVLVLVWWSFYDRVPDIEVS